MAACGSKLRRAEGGYLHFWCPGCDGAHMVGVGIGPGPRWDWNRSGDAPTFSPSVLVTGTDFTEEGWAMLERGEQPPGGKYPSRAMRCHSLVGCNGALPGQIKFLSDCTHALAGQTVELPDWPEPGWVD